MINIDNLTEQQLLDIILSDKRGLSRKWDGDVVIRSDKNSITLVYTINYYNASNEKTDFSDAYSLTASTDMRNIRRDLATGEVVTQYLKPDDSELKYKTKGKLKPWVDGQFVDWKRTLVESTDPETGDVSYIEGDYVIDSKWATAVSEYDFFVEVLNNSMLGDVKDWIVSTFVEQNKKGRFDI